MKEQLVAIVGPTAVGKTKLGVALAKELNGEVISADSMQVYRGMDIGTAKIKPEEMENIPHHFIDILEPDEEYSVKEFQEKAIKLISSLNHQGKLPILVGGTGLYVQAVTHQFQFPETETRQEVRLKWETYLKEHGTQALYEVLKERDPAYAEKVHANNYRRVLRALEIIELTGQSMSHYQQDWEKTSPYHLVMIGLTMERSQLYNRINQRVDDMIASGLIEEVETLINRGTIPEQATSLQAIGYKEIILYLQGQLSKEEAIELLKRNTRRFAKRQLTWFKRMDEITWFDVTDITRWNELEEIIKQHVKENLNQ